MRLLKEEAYKLFIKRKFILFFVSVILIEGMLAYASAQNIKLGDKAAQKRYESYMAELSGTLNNEKTEIIESLIQKDEEMTEKRSKLQKKYIEGEISYFEYADFLKEYNEYIVGYEGFSAFYENYSCAVEDDRDLIDEKPWNILFKNESIDFIAVLLITLCAVLTLVSDIESGCEHITFCSQNGKGKKFSVQIFMCILIAAGSSALIAYMRYAIINLSYGLNNKGLSFENLELFGENAYDMSIIKAYVLVSVIKVFGSVYLAVFTYFIGSVLKKSLLTGFTSFVLVFLPNYLLPDREYKYLLPLPSAFLTGNGYLFGDRINDTVYFRQITSVQLIVIFSIATIIMTLLLTGSYFITARRNRV